MKRFENNNETLLLKCEICGKEFIGLSYEQIREAEDIIIVSLKNPEEPEIITCKDCKAKQN